MCSYLTPHERARLEQVFRRLDRNGDGAITTREFKIACCQVNTDITDREVRKLVMDMDIDGNGMIDMEEFCLCMARHVASCRQRQVQQVQQAHPARQSLSTKQLREAFNYFDKDKSGTISQTELRQVMQTLGVRCSETEFQALLDNIDGNGDGVIDFEEFRKLLTSCL